MEVRVLSRAPHSQLEHNMPTLLRVFFGGIIGAALGAVAATAVYLTKHSDAPEKKPVEPTDDEEQS